MTSGHHPFKLKMLIMAGSGLPGRSFPEPETACSSIKLASIKARRYMPFSSTIWMASDLHSRIFRMRLNNGLHYWVSQIKKVQKPRCWCAIEESLQNILTHLNAVLMKCSDWLSVTSMWDDVCIIVNMADVCITWSLRWAASSCGSASEVDSEGVQVILPLAKQLTQKSTWPAQNKALKCHVDCVVCQWDPMKVLFAKNIIKYNLCNKLE